MSKEATNNFKKIIYYLLNNSEIVQSENFHHIDVSKNSEYETKELNCFSYIINKPDINEAERLLQIFKIPVDWAQAEFESRIEEEPKNPGTAYLKREEFWKKMLEKDGKFSYTYGKRMQKIGDNIKKRNGINQIKKIISELKEHKNTRQAIISIWDPDIDIERLNKRRIPCTIFYQFLSRKGKLIMICYSRSSDATSLLVSDYYQCIKMQEYIAKNVGLEVGSFIHIIGSLHMYKKDIQKAKNIENELNKILNLKE